MKLYYNDNGDKILVAEVITNHSMSVDDVLELTGINMDDFANEHGWDGWDFGALEMDYTDLMQQYREWRKISEEMLEDMSGSVDCGVEAVREDFSRYAGLSDTISFEEMLKLEKAY